MEAIILILLVPIIVYLVMNAQRHITETQTINEHLDPRKAFIHLKSKLIKTSAYTEESTYIILHGKIKSMACEFIKKHYSELAAQKTLAEIEEKFETYFEMDENRYRIKRTLNIEEVSNIVLLALSITSFCGANRKDGMRIEVNEFFCNRAIEYLIEERQFWPAKLAKALILKYGFKTYIAPNIQVSAVLFQEIVHTYPPAYEELENIDLFRQLDNIKSVHPGAVRAAWESHSTFEQKLKLYHPLNVNG